MPLVISLIIWLQGWGALIVDDYRMVMPLTWKKKWGIKYLYQPPFIQQLGVFSETQISDDELALFIKAMKRHFRFAEIFLNFQNQTTLALARQNYVLSLASGYEQLRVGYKKMTCLKTCEWQKKLK